MWSYTLNNLSDTEIDCLLSKKSLVQDSFFNLFDDYRFMNNIKAADKTSVNNRINSIVELVKKLLKGGK